MKVQLSPLYTELCEVYNSRCIPRFVDSLEWTYATLDGEVFLDASTIEGDHFRIFVELLRRLLHQPYLFVHPAPVDEEAVAACHVPSLLRELPVTLEVVNYHIPPRLLRIKIRLSQNVNNVDIQRLCELVPVQKTFCCLPSSISSYTTTANPFQMTGSITQQRWPEMAMIESLDLQDCIFVSLLGGRALRTAVRRNVYLQHIFLDRCSINPAVVRHVKAATQANRAAFRTVSEQQ